MPNVLVLSGWVCGEVEFSTRHGLFFHFSVGRTAEIEPGWQLTFLHGMGSKSG
jgi:hypothetical protein